MYKKIIFVLHLILFVALNAMDMELIDNAAQNNENKIQYFALLPREFRDYLAQSLIFNRIESEQELIERTKTETSKVPEKLYKDIFISAPFVFGQGRAPTLTAFCPNHAKIAIVERPSGNSKPIATIIDRHTNKIQSKITLPNFCRIELIALSSCGSLLALKHLKVMPKKDYTRALDNYVFSILNLKTQNDEDMQEIQHPLANRVNSIDFNKQGTHIIFQGSYPSQNPFNFCYQIISNKECEEKEKKTFDKFLIQKGISKGLIRKKD